MQSEPEAQPTSRSTPTSRDLVVVLVALAIAVLLERSVTGVARTGGIPNPLVQILASDLAVWVPLVLCAAWVLRRTNRSALIGRLGVGIGEVVAAIGIVIMCRAVDAAQSIAFFGTTGLSPQPTLGTPDVVLLVVSAIGTCLVSPFVEEGVFRGIFQRRLATELPRRAGFLAVIVTAFLFALVHVLIDNTTSSLGGFEVFVTTFLLGLLTGSLVALTGRVGGAIVAHVLFNAVAVVATWPG